MDNWSVCVKCGKKIHMGYDAVWIKGQGDTCDRCADVVRDGEGNAFLPHERMISCGRFWRRSRPAGK